MSASSLALVGALTAPASAQTWTGATSTDWTVGSNWSGGAPPVTGGVTINAAPSAPVLGVLPGAVGSTGALTVGNINGSSASLTIQNGSVLTTLSGIAHIGGSAFGHNTSVGTVLVDGNGSQWNVANNILIGRYGTGSLTISNQGSVSAGSYFAVGDGGTGSNVSTLNILSGGTLTTAAGYLGNLDNTTGTATVDGIGSRWTLSELLRVGRQATGILNIQNGGTVTAQAGVSLRHEASSAGTLNVNSNGVLETTALTRGPAGTGSLAQVNFDGGTLRALTNNGSFITNFDGTQFNLAAGGMTVDSNGFAVTAAVPLTGVGGLTKIGNGTLTLSSTNLYSGGTTITTGTLQLGSGGTTGSLVGDVLNDGTLAFNRSNAYTFGGLISGTGAVNKLGGGTTTLTANNSYSGQTTISVGTLALTGIGSVANSSRVVANGTFNIEGVAGAGTSIQSLAGTGAVTLGTKILTLTNANDVFSGIIGGAGGLTVARGAQTLTGTNTYTGGTIISAGTLQLGDGGTSGSILGDVLNNGALAFNRSDTLTFGGLITGTGAVNQLGAGTTVLTADNTYTGITTISAGTLQLGNGGASGSIAGDILNNSILAINRSNQVILPGNISGIGTLNHVGTGTTVLTGTNTYTGGTNITAGTLQVGNGGTIGSTVGNVANAGTLAFNRSNSMDFAGVISGAGTIRQIGSGLTNLTGNSFGFAGTTNIDVGTLAVNGSLCGDVNVLAGGRLQGIGTVCDTTNFAGGTIGPGNSIGTLTVAGNYVGNGGLLEIETVLGSDASPTDRLVVTGDTAGSTNVRVINVGGTGAPTVEGIKIVDVGGVSNGVFTLLGDYTFLGQSAVIAGAYAYVLQKNGVSTPLDGDWYLRSNLTVAPPAPPIPGEPPPPPAPLPGPIFAPTVPVYESYARVMLSLNELPTMQQRIGHRFRSGPDAMASMGVAGASAATFSPLWARVEGGHKNLNPVATARSTLDIDHYKFEGGADLVNVETGAGKWLVGVVGNYVEGNADVYSLFGDGRIRVTGGGVGGTVTWLGDAGFYFDGQGRASWYSGDLRSLAVGPIVSGNDGFGYAFGAEVGHRLGIGGGWSITPQVQVNYSNVEYDDFTDRFNGRVSLRNGESLLGRGGFSINHQHSWRDAAGQLVRSDVYGIANAYYEFMNGNTTLVSDTAFASSIDRLWGSIGAGGTFSWADDKYALYGEVSYRSSLNQPGDSYSYRGTAGFRVRW